MIVDKINFSPLLYSCLYYPDYIKSALFLKKKAFKKVVEPLKLP